AEAELGLRCEQLLTPLTRYHPARPTEPFAIDNGAFSGFDERAFVSLLERERPRRHLCPFAEGPAMALENGHERFCGRTASRWGRAGEREAGRLRVRHRFAPEGR